MPIRKVKGGWRFGHSGLFKRKAKAVRAYRAYKYFKAHPSARKHGRK